MTPYLIAHKVRGEPAFDIALRCDDMGTPSDPGPWWIMNSTGHRCYPYWNIKVSDLEVEARVVDPRQWAQDPRPLEAIVPPLPDDLDDFCGYSIAPAEAADAAIRGNNLLQSLGLLKPKAPIVRRI